MWQKILKLIRELETPYRKIIILGSTLAVIELLILTGLNSRMKNYYDYLSTEEAFLLANQIRTAVVNKNFNLAELTEYTKHNTRQILRRFTTEGSRIRSILLIDSDNIIVVSTEPVHEGDPYVDPREIENLSTRSPKVAGRRLLTGNTEELDVIWPVIDEGVFKGHIRANIWLDNRQAFEEAQVPILGITGSLIATIFFLVVWIMAIFDRRTPQAVQPAAQNSPAPQNNAPIQADKAEDYGTVFSRLNKLYDKTADLEQSFQESEEKIHSMMRVLNQGLLIMDVNMNIITYNEYLVDVLQIRSTASAQRKVFELFQKNPRLLEIYRRAKDPLIHEIKQNFPITLLTGRQINSEVLARPLYNGEHVAGVTFYIKNLEMLNELEHSLQRSMKYGVISQLSSSIGHEIRNPLSSLAIHTEIVDNMVTKSVEDRGRLKKIKKSIGILNSEVERLQKLIDQFFNLAKAQEIHLTFENINELMAEVIDLVYQQALEKGVKINRHLAKNLPLVKVSKDQLKQVIINLILNAYDAMPQGGELTLRTQNRDGNVIISVKDSGLGIPENVRDNIFDLYFTTKDSGGGIGLAICRKIIEAHEGKLYFETETGVGTVFHIELPTS